MSSLPRNSEIYVAADQERNGYKAPDDDIAVLVVAELLLMRP